VFFSLPLNGREHKRASARSPPTRARLAAGLAQQLRSWRARPPRSASPFLRALAAAVLGVLGFPFWRGLREAVRRPRHFGGLPPPARRAPPP